MHKECSTQLVFQNVIRLLKNRESIGFKILAISNESELTHDIIDEQIPSTKSVKLIIQMYHNSTVFCRVHNRYYYSY